MRRYKIVEGEVGRGDVKIYIVIDFEGIHNLVIRQREIVVFNDPLLLFPNLT